MKRQEKMSLQDICSAIFILKQHKQAPTSTSPLLLRAEQWDHVQNEGPVSAHVHLQVSILDV